MAGLFELLARGRAASPAADSSMLAILEHNEDMQMLQENVDQRWVIDTEPQVTMARTGEAIVKAWGPAPAPRSTP